MKRIALILLWLVVAVGESLAQDADPVVMTIAGRPVLRSEFEYSLNKNAESPVSVTEQDVKDYVDLFINYRLKVQAALDAKLDTLSSFQQEFRTYRDIQLKPFVYDSMYVDSVARDVYAAVKESIGDADVAMISHILLSVPQNSNKSLLDQQKLKADSLYQALLNGADFASLAKQYSDDSNTAAAGGRFPMWIAPDQYFPEFNDAVFALHTGEFSQPVLTPVGYHIILMHERMSYGTYEQRRPEIINILHQRGIRQEAAERMIQKIIAESNGTMTREDVMLQIQQIAESLSPNLKYLIAEYYDGLLLYEASNRLVWQKAALDDKGMDKYFQKNKEKFKWESPRMRGYVFRTRSKAMIKKITKILKSYKEDEGLALLKDKLPADSLKFIKVHFGVFKQGDDPIVDFVKFKTTNPPRDNMVLPYYGVVGKILKQPMAVIDVKSQIVSQYQDIQEELWIEELRNKYTVTIDQQVLSTINKH